MSHTNMNEWMNETNEQINGGEVEYQLINVDGIMEIESLNGPSL